MLIEFTVRNFMSLRNEQTISFVPTALTELVDENTFETNVEGVGRVLKSATIYGANAAGKSNVLVALMKMRSMVIKSAGDDAADHDLPVTPFIFDESAESATLLQAVFVHKGLRYQYGFECTRERILEEWMYVYPERRAQTVFKRTWDPEAKTYDWDLKKPWLKGSKAQWRNATGPRSLFVSVAARDQSEQMAEVKSWFQKNIVDGSIADANKTAAAMEGAAMKKMALALLNAADLNVADVRTELQSGANDPNPILVAFRAALPAEAQKAFDAAKSYNIYIKHGIECGKEVWIPFRDESRGTREFFSDLGPMVLALATGSLLVFDELNNNLHPLLARAIVRFFHSSEWNPLGAQLLFTTHETALLTTDILRRDQVWFAEKDEKGASRIYPLTDFETRKETSLERQYLHGRFRAIPFISENRFKSIFQDEGEVTVDG